MASCKTPTISAVECSPTIAATAVAATLPEQLLLCHVQGDVTYEQVARMNVTQFRQVMATAKLMSPSYSSDKVDDIFNNMAALCRVSCGRGDQWTAGSHAQGIGVWGKDATKKGMACKMNKQEFLVGCQVQQHQLRCCIHLAKPCLTLFFAMADPQGEPLTMSSCALQAQL